MGFQVGVKAGGGQDNTESALLVVAFTGSGYVITTAGGALEVTLESWNGPQAHGFQSADHDRTFFDISIKAKLGKGNEFTEGVCGNFDGNAENDFGFGDLAGVQQSANSHMACNQVKSQASLFELSVGDIVGGFSNAGAKCENIGVNGMGDRGTSIRFKNSLSSAIQEAGVLAGSSSDAKLVHGTAAADKQLENKILTEASRANRELCSGMMLKEVVA